MAELEMLEHYKKMRESNIVFDFRGAISQDILVEMVEMIKNKFSRNNENSNVAKKIFSVFIEMAQNIAKYSAEKSHLDASNSEVGNGIIVLTEKDKEYTIISGNLVDERSLPFIIEHCKKINRMNNDELKQYYKNQLKTERKKDKDGAGIGLIDIVRKSGNPISYKISPVDDNNSFLVLSAKIQ